ncbi:MAG: hypothetical protein NZ602_10600 [Thermoguttaceae bacterium]|nr:hypothetical protein [Thermoguttaceae bacterium]MDW8037692.1 hypothetical protein [Thermoguttaceae bacterium]
MRIGSAGWLAGVLQGLVAPGCAFLPQVAKVPVLENPFPEVRRVAVSPFFNLSEEPTVDGRQFALAYYNALQSVPGFEVIPVGQVERAMREYGINLNSPQEACRLAQILGADAIVIGAVTDYSPYYPPRLGLRVEWYPAQPGPPSSSRALGKKSCGCEPCLGPLNGEVIVAGEEYRTFDGINTPIKQEKTPHDPPIFPLVTHTRIYNGHDAEFTSALSQYHLTRDDARFAGWQTYLERSDDFIRFCCYKHLEEMLIQQGGAGKTKLVWRWSAIR